MNTIDEIDENTFKQINTGDNFDEFYECLLSSVG